MFTPVKVIKGQSDPQKQRGKAYMTCFLLPFLKPGNLYKYFLNWLEEHTKIQRVHAVRSTFDILVHRMRKIVLAFII